MIRSFVFSQGKLVSQDLTLDLLKLVLYDEDAQIWVDLESPSEEEAKGALEGVFNFHPLSIEDCINVSERPKVEDYDSYFFMVIHAVDYSSSEHAFCTSELNLFIGKNYLVTYHDKPLRSIAGAVDRIKKNATAVARAPDRLTYHILDLLLDNYEPALEDLQHEFDELESAVLTDPGTDLLQRFVDLKGEVQHLRQIVAPQRETIAKLSRGEFKLVRAHMLPYYRDLLDRLVRISDLAETFRDNLTDTMHLNLGMQQAQANKVMKVLTVLATLSMPLVLVTSFYGMNFRHMPELEVPHAHLFVFAVTTFLTVLIYWILRKKRWL